MKHPKSTFRLIKQFRVLLLIAAVFFIYKPLQASEELFPEAQHPKVSHVIARLLTQYHYSHLQLTDSLSSEIFDRYLDNLDGNHSSFLASDIEKFEKYRFALDDLIDEGNLFPAYEIFNTYKKREEARIQYAFKRLQEPFDFSKDDTYRFDRSDMDWPATEAELREIWRERLKNEALSLKLAGKDTADIAETLTNRYKNRQRRFEQFKSEDVFQFFMNAVTESFDPHTNYFSPITSDNFQIQMSLSFEGIGARLTTEDDYTKVAEIIPGGPADLSGQLQAKDKIIGVGQGRNGEIVDVVGWRLDDVVQLIRGKRGTIVRLEIISADAEPGAPTKTITLVRDKVKLEEQAAKSEIIEIENEKGRFKLGVIKIPSFYSDISAQSRGDKNYKSTSRDVRRLLIELQAKNVDGVIVDLRHDGGGSLQEAIRVSGLFIRKGPVVQVRDSRGRIDVDWDPDPEIVYDGPLAVMLDWLSASASEIFAAAMQDYGRALIVGGQSFGKGTVQNLLPLNRFLRNTPQKLGQLKVTIAKFYRITGGSTQHRGVIPDIVFPMLSEEQSGESSRPNALMWDRIQATHFQKYGDLSRLIPDLELQHKKRVAKNKEYQLLLEQLKEARHNEDRKTISLNYETRKKEREEATKKRRERENARRIARGLAPLKEGEKADSNEKEPDPLLEETGHLLADMVILTQAALTGPIR